MDVGFDRLTIMMAGAPAKVDDFEELIRVYGIVELQRTGRVALPMLDRRRAARRRQSGAPWSGNIPFRNIQLRRSDHTEKAG